ncbi:hypothetical protein TNCV_2839951 [Trichonephila clavipes]|uniref:Uncharacterized protein n=1 Tax=Trichonephila clavipes TaxID=2585209 RepID=A0A8X6RNI2_TRICX|nr:hypothetical protein TNCV_2839951 [Trichonephila clavipes]
MRSKVIGYFQHSIHLDASLIHRIWQTGLKQGKIANLRDADMDKTMSELVNRRIRRQATAASQFPSDVLLQHVQDTFDLPIPMKWHRVVFSRKFFAFIGPMIVVFERGADVMTDPILPYMRKAEPHANAASLFGVLSHTIARYLVRIQSAVTSQWYVDDVL